MNLLIERIDDDGVQTVGRMYVLDEYSSTQFSCDTIELSWKENKVGESCIPKGEYNVVKRVSNKFGKHFHITNVEGRTFILIHSGNFHHQILGCVLVGDNLKDINNDGRFDVTNSSNTMKKLLKIMPEEFKLTIV